MQSKLLSNLAEISREIEDSQQGLLNLRRYPLLNKISSSELILLNGALEELDNCRLTLNGFRDKIIRNKIQGGEDATDE